MITQRRHAIGLFISRGFTLLEILMVLAIIGILAAILIPKLVQVVPSADESVARSQAKALSDAVAHWLIDQPSIAQARAAYNPSTSSDAPASTTAFLAALQPYFSADTQGVFFMSPSDSTVILTQTLQLNGWTLRILWPGASYQTSEPQIEFQGP